MQLEEHNVNHGERGHRQCLCLGNNTGNGERIITLSSSILNLLYNITIPILFSTSPDKCLNTYKLFFVVVSSREHTHTFSPSFLSLLFLVIEEIKQKLVSSVVFSTLLVRIYSHCIISICTGYSADSKSWEEWMVHWIEWEKGVEREREEREDEVAEEGNQMEKEWERRSVLIDSLSPSFESSTSSLIELLSLSPSITHS